MMYYEYQEHYEAAMAEAEAEMQAKAEADYAGYQAAQEAEAQAENEQREIEKMTIKKLIVELRDMVVGFDIPHPTNPDTKHLHWVMQELLAFIDTRLLVDEEEG